MVHRRKPLIDTSSGAWIRNNPGKTMTIYHIPSMIPTTFPISLTITNIQTVFRYRGIFPYNGNIFTALDYVPVYVTDSYPILIWKRSLGNRTKCVVQVTNLYHRSFDLAYAHLKTKLSTQGSSLQERINTHDGFVPGFVRPFPKASPRKDSNKSQKKRKSTIYNIWKSTILILLKKKKLEQNVEKTREEEWKKKEKHAVCDWKEKSLWEK